MGQSSALPAADSSTGIIGNCDLKKKKKIEQKPCTLQAKSIDFYGPGEIDEGMCVQNVDTDELLGQVDYNT